MPVLLNFLYLAVIGLLMPALAVRSWKTGRYRRYLRDKYLGLERSPVNGDAPVAWFHGVSVGEVNLLKIVTEGFRKRHPNWRIIVSSTTDTGLAEARKHFGEGAVIPYPFDFSWAVDRTLKMIKPRFIALAESELWPNFLYVAKRHRVPVIVLNGRMSPRTFSRYAKVAGLARGLMFGRVSRFLMQSERFADHLRQLGVPNDRVRVTGSVKYDGVLADRYHPKVAELRRLFTIQPDDIIWVAGSTHAPEEQIVTEIYARLKSRFPKLRLIIVPRSPDRFDEVAGIIRQANLTCERRREMTGPVSDPAAVILGDTMGELGAIWALATIGFTGGSLNDQRGGQSMIEPAGLGVPVMFGPHTWNFKDAVAGLLEVGGAIRLTDGAELEQKMAELIADPKRRTGIGEAAREFVLRQQGATTRTLDEIDDLLRIHP
ncbi:3-deoxy-D-manno-octulosonic acid transferase [Zavarzinella formosa]|uniref:3-deoxy-D-manno-octulosonic acid transferase n=1 Tax=Zavarzinella formosa TaxID=360055 RepID=UPI0002E53974|nr:3-deoxy-D-manno-octulosonic acid transferase [Zavarzinella formosa]